MNLSSSTLVKLCVLLCILNIALTIGLAGAGVLKATETGDIQYTKTQPVTDFFENALDREEFELPEDSPDRFAIESPTDANIYYNTVVRVKNGGYLYDLGYKYSPPIYFVFVPFYNFGYTGFKYLWLAFMILSVGAGTYLILRTEAPRHGIELPRFHALSLSIAALGFTPVLSNLKVGQVTPLIYLCIGVCWWGFRKDRPWGAGGALAVAALMKPYVGSPLVALYSRDNITGTLGFIAVYLLAIAVSIAVFGVETLSDYVQVVLAEATQSEIKGGSSLVERSVETLDPLFFLGPLKLLGQGFIFGLLLYVAYTAEKSKEYTNVFAFSLVSIPFIISNATNIYLAALLAPVILLGYRYYSSDERKFKLVVVSFLALMLHPYVMELLMGKGHPNIATMVAQAGLPTSPLLILQPGIYGLFLLFGLIVYSFEWDE